MEVDKIDDQFHKLLLAFKEQSGFSQMLQNTQACSTFQSFEQCWSPHGIEFEALQRFVGLLQSLYGGLAASNKISSWSIEQRIPAHKA